MSTLPEQFSAAGQSHVEAQIALFQTYATTAVEKAEKIIALNLSTTRASMEKSSAAVRQLLAAQDTRDLFALTNQTQESFERFLAYGRELFGIASGTAPQAKQAAPVVAPPVPEQPPAPTAAPLAAPEAKAEAPAAPAVPPAAKVKPIAKAVSKAAPPEAPPKPAAAPFPVVAKSAEPKQLDMLVPKPKAKKNPK